MKMKRIFYKILSLMMSFVLLLSALYLNAYASQDEVIYGVLRNGVVSDYKYSDEYFSRDSYTYFSDLALISLHFAMSVMYNPNGARRSIPHQRVPEAGIEFLHNLGYDTVIDYGYRNRCTIDGIACTIGQKNIDKNDETIIALGIRGSDYDWEWGGNFKIGTGIEHEGFSKAKDETLKCLADFIKLRKDTFNSDVKLWITGYSRSAAAGNLLAAAIDNNSVDAGYDFEAKNVYAYVFEAPGSSRADDAKGEAYGNIFNVVNPIDIVPRFVPKQWGYSRYGKDILLPSLENNEDYDILRSKMEKEYKSISNMTYYENFCFYQPKSFNDVLYSIINSSSGKALDPFKVNESIGQGAFLDGLIEMLANEVIKSPQNYEDNYQNFLVKLLSAVITNNSNLVFTFDVNELLSDLFSFCQTNIVNLFLHPMKFSDSLRRLLAEYLTENLNVKNIYYPEGITSEEYYDLLGEVDDFLFAFLRHPDYAYTTYKYLTNKSPDGDLACFIPHYQEVELAWMRALDE